MMTQFSNLPARRWALLVLVLTPLLSCGGDTRLDFPRPTEPLETTVFDLLEGPLDRASAFDVVAGRGLGEPRAVRVDQSAQWDIAFAEMGGQPVWLPRGFFEANEPSSGITLLNRAFEEITNVPGNSEDYEGMDPVPASVGAVYAIRSRSDPTLSLPCRVFAKLEVLSIEFDPARVQFRFLWNPNCDDTNVTPEDS